MNTFTYIISSMSQNDDETELHDVKSMTLYGLPNHEHFYCEVACLISYPGFQEKGNHKKIVELKVSSNFLSQRTNIEQRNNDFSTLARYNNSDECYCSYRSSKFIIPNFNNKSYRFKEFYNDGTEVLETDRENWAGRFGNWVLYLHLTPITKEPIPKLIESNFYTYFLSSSEKIGGTITDCFIRMNSPFNTRKLFVIVKSFIINYESINTISAIQDHDRGITLVANDLCLNGYMSENRGLQYLISLPILQTNGNHGVAEIGSKFICENWKNKEINFQLHDFRRQIFDLNHTIIDQNDITTNWLCQMLIYPYD